MTAQELRQKFLKFFKENNHKIIPPAPLIPSEEQQLEGKERVLFTSAGMQPLIPYLLGKTHPEGKKLADVQKCLRTDDIEEVGDAVHHTFFEMLGNWSLGDYWKDEAIRLSFEFLTKELKIPLEKLAVTVFAGDEAAPKDEESAKEWEKQGIPKERIFYFSKEHNWWPTGEKSGPCGPDTEMFYWTGKGHPEGKPNENPLWVEIWNDVFMQFNRKEDGSLEDLPQKNVDTGMGLERALAVLNGKDNDYETDLFLPIIDEIRKSNNKYDGRSERIIADHIKAAVFLMAENIKPDPKDNRGSIVRRLLTEALFQESKLLEADRILGIIEQVIDIYRSEYPELADNSQFIKQELKTLLVSIETIINGSEIVNMRNQFIQLKETLKFDDPKVRDTAAGKIGYFYHQSKGIPEAVVFSEALNIGLDLSNFKEGYKEEFKKHQEISRSAQKGMFKGGLADHSDVVIKYHTATHLLHQALRDVLGPEVFQKGSNITAERLRFDFSFDRKMTDEEIRKTEEIINERITQDLKVDHMTVSLDEAKKMNAIGLFNEKYADKVSIYGVGPGFELDKDAKDQRDRGGYYSLEFCGGPHVENTAVLGGVKIVKEEAISAGIRRIRAQLV